MTDIKALICVIAMLGVVAPAFGQSTPKQRQAQESTGEAASQKQLGGQVRDRQISRRIFRHSENRLVHAPRHHHL